MRLVALSVVLRVVSWAEADDSMQRMLPLAVGNRWDYGHYVTDSKTGTRLEHDVVISITHTEDIEGHTYYVFSDMPYEEPPVPFFFLAGKKVRWEGNHLLFRQQDRDVALYQFEYQEIERGGLGEIRAYNYTISETDRDIVVDAKNLPPPKIAGLKDLLFKDDILCLSIYVLIDHPAFEFLLNSWNKTLRSWNDEGAGYAYFFEHYGMTHAYTTIAIEENPGILTANSLYSRSASINGARLEFRNDTRASAKIGELRCNPTLIRALSWGALKRKFTYPESEGGGS